MKIAVVGLGKIGLPLAVQFAGAGHRVVGADIDPGVVQAVSRAEVAVPRRVRAAGAAGRRRRVGGAGGDHRHRVGGLGERGRDRRGAAVRGRRRGPRLRRPGRCDHRRGPRTAAGHPGQLRDDVARGHHPQPADAAAGAGQRPARGARPVRGVQPGAGLLRPGLRRPGALPEAGRRGRPGERAARRGLLPRRAALRRAARPGSAERRVGPGLGRGRGVRQAGRDHLPGRQHRTGQPVRPARRPDRRRHPTGSSRPATRSRSATCTHPGSRSAATASRSTRGSTWPATRRRRSCGRPAPRTARCPSGRCSCSPTRSAACTGRPWSCSAPATGVGSRRPRSPGCSEWWPPCTGAARGRWCTTRCSARASSPASGSSRIPPGNPCGAAILQADHAEYRDLTPADLPGLTALLDGRGVLDADRWPGVAVLRLGSPPPPTGDVDR